LVYKFFIFSFAFLDQINSLLFDDLLCFNTNNNNSSSNSSAFQPVTPILKRSSRQQQQNYNQQSDANENYINEDINSLLMDQVKNNSINKPNGIVYSRYANTNKSNIMEQNQNQSDYISKCDSNSNIIDSRLCQYLQEAAAVRSLSNEDLLSLCKSTTVEASKMQLIDSILQQINKNQQQQQQQHHDLN
jgi:hypothetical protein